MNQQSNIVDLLPLLLRRTRVLVDTLDGTGVPLVRVLAFSYKTQILLVTHCLLHVIKNANKLKIKYLQSSSPSSFVGFDT